MLIRGRRVAIWLAIRFIHSSPRKEDGEEGEVEEGKGGEGGENEEEGQEFKISSNSVVCR